MGIQIMTDSAGDLPQAILDEYGIEMISLHVYCGEEQYLDSRTIFSKDMLNEMRAGKVYKTAQADPAQFIERFKAIAERGDSCLYVGFSSGLSATYQSAVLAKTEVLQSYPDFRVELIDTKCASMGQGLVAYKVARWLREGCSFEELVEKTIDCANRMQHIFTVDDLEYLYRGGRVSRTSAVVGGILNIKPILHVLDGKLVPLEKIRGRNKVIRRMVELMGERGKDLKDQTIAITHGDDLEAAEKLMDAIKESYGCSDFIINNIGCAVGAHSGPGTLALFFLN